MYIRVKRGWGGIPRQVPVKIHRFSIAITMMHVIIVFFSAFVTLISHKLFYILAERERGRRRKRWSVRHSQVLFIHVIFDALYAFKKMCWWCSRPNNKKNKV